ncbi:MAG: hypothetical protein J0L55_06195 [Caulobacterales bacterium]|nr:hypothetical protein [Caulobacterales bacterium]MCA0373604.1 hypothetical protein [Pseudomonadota bacterium]
MNSLNLILQAKNDVGKTYIASIVAEYFQAKGSEFHGYDADKSESSFAKFEDFKVEPVEVVDTDHHFKLEAFDKVWENAIAKNLDIILDSGVDAFGPLVQYFVKNGNDNLSAESKNEIIVHAVIAGGDRLDDTINGLVTLFNKLPTNMKIVVWLNEYFGPIEVAGKPFEEFKIYENNREKIHGIIKICEPNSDLVKADLLKKNALKMTFNECKKSDEFSKVSKQRFEEYRGKIFEQLDEIFLANVTSEGRTKAQKIDETKEEMASPNKTENHTQILSQSLNEETLAKYEFAINALFEKHLEQLSSLNALHFSEANKNAEIVITQAAEYLTKQLNQAANEIAASTSKLLAEQISDATKAAAEAKNSRNWAIFAACAPLFAAIAITFFQ